MPLNVTVGTGVIWLPVSWYSEAMPVTTALAIDAFEIVKVLDAEPVQFLPFAVIVTVPPASGSTLAP